MAFDLGRVAVLEAKRDEFSLAGRVGGFTRSAWWDAELLLAEATAFLLLRRRDCKRPGGTSAGSVGTTGAGAGGSSHQHGEMQAARGQ